MKKKAEGLPLETIVLLIIVLVVIIAVVFLGIMLRKPVEIESELKIEDFLVLSYLS